MNLIITYIALGSNLNQPEQQLRRAIEALKQLPSSTLKAVSSFYKNPPHEPAPGTVQDDYVNAVAELHTSLSPENLLQELHRIEREQGRVRSHIKNMARTLDLDIILYGNEQINTEVLTIPHPRFLERDFVLIPLREIAPTLFPNGET